MSDQPKLPEEVVIALPSWKSQYGDIYLTQLGDKILVYRGLTFHEVDHYNDIAKREPTLAEDYLLSSVILYPTDLVLDQLPTAFVDKFIKTVTQISAVTSPEAFTECLQKGREYANTLEGFAVAFISHAFHISPEKVREMTVPILARYIAMAEVVLGKEFSFADTSAPPKAAKKGIKPTREQMVASAMELRRQQNGRGRPQESLPPIQFPKAPPPLDPRAVPPSSMNFAADNAALRDFGFGGE